MKTSIAVFALIAILMTSSISLPSSFGQFAPGGVDMEGEWYAGEGLQKGDYFSYEMCHIDYKECADFQMDLWVEGDIKVGTEDKWLVQAVVYDGNKVVKGNMELGKIAPEPTGGSSELSVYRGAFKTSITWLSAFATAEAGSGGEGPKKFTAKSWGKIGNIGGEQVIPTEIVTVSTPAGVFADVVRVDWRTGGYTSHVWIVDGFPFPIKAQTLTHVSEGIPPPEYTFTLLEYRANVPENPFTDIITTAQKAAELGCPENYELVDVKKPTVNYSYSINMKYGPESPPPGCEIEWFINFMSKYDQTEFLNQVQYDLLVVDENQTPIRSIAQDEGRHFLYSPSGQIHISTLVEEEPGVAHYVLWIYGLSPEYIVPGPEELDFLPIDIAISGEAAHPKSTTLNIPDWIKNNAKWWADGQIDDTSFVSGIQYMINQGIMKIPQTSQGSDSGSNEIPSWIKNNAGWWADGQIDDTSFVSGLQYLIENGIVRIS